VPVDLPVEILLVEDNEGDVHLARKALEQWAGPVNLTIAADGEKAMSLLGAPNGHEALYRPDLVLLDWNLPRLDGRGLLAWIKSDPRLKEIPVIVLSSSRSDADILEGYRLQANCCLSKPTRFDGLVAMMKSIEYFWCGRVQLAGHA
jgi:CheY-like chemotaxis protein